MMKVIDVLCKAYGWQGGTIHEALRHLPDAPQNDTAYKWGVREGHARRHGPDIAAYPVPFNSWGEGSVKECATSYVMGLRDGLEVREAERAEEDEAAAQAALAEEAAEAEAAAAAQAEEEAAAAAEAEAQAAAEAEAAQWERER